MLDIKEHIRCPFCTHRLSFTDADCRCSKCDRIFPVIAGIPDLRVPIENDWIDFEEDRMLASLLAEKYVSHSFEQLVDEVWSKRQNVPPEIVKKRIRQINQGAEKYTENLTEEGWLGSQLTNPAENWCIELGCGTGGFLEAAIPRLKFVVGVDISLTWLVVTKKRLEEKGLTGTIVCACIESLPFEADQFDFAVAFDVIEHVTDPQVMVEEVHRVISPGGKMFCTTPNRYSLSAEPHVGIWGVGFLPRRLMQPYVRWRNGMTYKGTYPQSLFNLRQLFRREAHFDLTIDTPVIWSREVAAFSPVKRTLAQIYNRITRVGFVRFVLLPIAPFFQVVARKIKS